MISNRILSKNMPFLENYYSKLDFNKILMRYLKEFLYLLE